MKRIPIYILAVALVGCGDKEPTAKALVAPANLRITETAATSLTWEWDAVADARGYVCKQVDGTGKTLSSVNVTEPKLIMTGLTLGQSYRVAVKALAQDSKNDSPYTDVVVGTTKEGDIDPPPPPPPGDDFGFPAWENDALVRAFPGAEGGGMFATGGRGGKVLHVTKLTDDSSTGTLRWAVNQTGARTVVFDVDGIIELNSTLEIKNDNITIAGQTAPGDGICLKNYPLAVKANNVIIRFIRCRMGDAKDVQDDAMTGYWEKRNIIIDHCSMSWSTDECASFYKNENFTMQWSILSESLRISVHEKGTHGYGAIWGGVNVSFHHNLLAHHDSRNPRFDGADEYKPYKSSAAFNTADRSVDYRNCVVYNFSNFAAYGGEQNRVNFVNNYYKWGPASLNGPQDGTSGKRRLYFYSIDEWKKANDTKVLTKFGMPSIYAGGNYFEVIGGNAGFEATAATLSTNTWAGFIYAQSDHTSEFTKLISIVPIMNGTQACRVTNHTAQLAFDRVLDFAGASLHRDAVDLRAVNDTRTGTATIMTGSKGSRNGYIDTPSDAGGYPVYASGTVQTDTDGDGVPDWWEEKYGLNKNNAADGNTKTLDPTGRYTNLEVYLHWLVKDIVLAETEGGTYITLN